MLRDTLPALFACAGLVLGCWLVANGRLREPRRLWPLAAAIFLGWCWAYWPFTVDDAYISLRVARNVAAGHGFLFNVGEPAAEVHSNFLLVALEALGFRFGFSDAAMIVVQKIQGVGFGLLLVFLVPRLARSAGASGASAALAGLAVAAVPMVGLWAVGGLETMMALALAALALQAWMARSPWAGLAFLAVALARTEGVLLLVAYLGWEAVALARALRRADVQWGRWLGPFMALAAYALYSLWRVWTFGSLLPNPAVAKAVGHGAFGLDLVSTLSLRLRLDATTLLALVVPIAFAGWAAWNRRADDKARKLVAALAIALAFPLLVAPDWMPGARYYLPILVPLAALAALALDDTARALSVPSPKPRRSLGPEGLAAGLALGLLVVGSLGTFDAQAQVAFMERGIQPFGDWLRDQDWVDSIVLWDQGYVPFVSNVPLSLENWPSGLISRDVAERGINVASLLDRSPDLVVLPFFDAAGGAAPPWLEELRAFPEDDQFRAGWSPLFSVAQAPDRVYVVHVRNDLSVPPASLLAAQNIEVESFTAACAGHDASSACLAFQQRQAAAAQGVP